MGGSTTKLVLQNAKKLSLRVLVSLLLITSANTFAEDIELYISDAAKQNTERPQVLIIFDNSGSMGNTEKVKVEYDPNINYPATNGFSALTSDYVYYNKGSEGVIPVVDDPDEGRRILTAVNGCQSAQTALNTLGFYNGRIREYSFSGNSGSWKQLPDNNASNVRVIDCEEDVIALNHNNAGASDGSGNVNNLGNGYPVDGQGTLLSPQYHTSNATDSNVSWTGRSVTLYSDNYLRWYHNASLPKEWRSRMDIAQKSVSDLIRSAPYVDFGLQVFNRNNSSSRSGGRIIAGIKEHTSSYRTTLLNKVDSLFPDGNTPLCETLYEASRYFAGKGVYYGNDYDINPKRDQSIEQSGSYISPLTSCADKVYVILISDGQPTADTSANNLITSMPQAGQDPMGPAYNDTNVSNNYLPALAQWLNNNDINTSLDGKQTSSLYTIGFGSSVATAAPILAEAATLGGGKYFPAKDSISLTAALINVLVNLDTSNDSLTSASVASNNFDRTETLDYVYYAMFQPEQGPRWQGNMKKYKVVNGVQKGKLGEDAVNSDGIFSEDATSYWSPSKDGDLVSKGGVAEMLRGLTSARTVYSDLGTGGALKDLNRSHAITAFGSRADLAVALDVADDDDVIDDYLDWAKGLNTDDVKAEDESIPFMRPDVFGDPLHSKPIVINYGNDKIYVVVGTNQGALHMFKDDSVNDQVSESWAFMPKGLFPNIKPLRENYTSTNKVYGVDGQITSHIVDHDGDGIVNGSDEVWIFFGLRRGGNSYYALNVTNPESPQLMWHIKAGDAGFDDLGQTWSQPKVAYSTLNTTGTNAKPVLIFGGGYDTTKDANGVGGNDNVGKAIYMIDAEQGNLLWSLAPTGDTTFTGTDSIPSSIATLDSDGDGLTDRLYTGDTGGNVWRIDMPGSDKSKFSVFKLASLGGSSANTVDRRFFNEPAIARAIITETLDTGENDQNGDDIIVQQETPYDAILIGSGDRVNPLGTDTDDKFFMIKDINIRTQQFPGTVTPITPVPTTILLSDLYDYTNDPFGGSLSTQALEALSLDVSNHDGWYMSFTQTGEKSSASGLVINNVAYFTSYTPPELGVNAISCNLPNGQGWLYAIDLALGTKKYNWAAEDSRNRSDHISFVNEQFLGAPTLIVTDIDDGDPTTDDSTGQIIVGRKTIDAPLLPRTLRNYLYIDEQ
ncbi:rRNA (guanine-N1)-methyltransferase [Colwellia sp. D2M02]|uniref:pilus assembly protein n=1 Tax=Colwellia sp. D2M02 TaxID=2841562 RepID=UPI001C0863B3|nr:PilC/PilY family type IV pilus protein [Colwellia sp. D2M02]MBU2892893.1 rRNA (guanine-N1)-methyltransferase [Colwellia sp. D2M02]